MTVPKTAYLFSNLNLIHFAVQIFPVHSHLPIWLNFPLHALCMLHRLHVPPSPSRIRSRLTHSDDGIPSGTGPLDGCSRHMYSIYPLTPLCPPQTLPLLPLPIRTRTYKASLRVLLSTAPTLYYGKFAITRHSSLYDDGCTAHNQKSTLVDQPQHEEIGHCC